MKSLEIVNEKLETGDIVTIVTKDYWLMTKEELETIKQDLERKEKLEEVIEILRPIICLGENIEEGGNEYWLASDRRLFHLTKEQYELINEVLSK